MRDMVSGVSVGRIAGNIVLDLNKNEEDAPDAVDMPVAILPNSSEIVLFQMDGLLKKDELDEALELALEASKKVYELQKEALTVSVPADYTMLMSVIAHAILKERVLYEEELQGKYRGNREKLFKDVPQARGFLREPARLFSKREQAMELLDAEAKKHLPEMRETLYFPFR